MTTITSVMCKLFDSEKKGYVTGLDLVGSIILYCVIVVVYEMAIIIIWTMYLSILSNINRDPLIIILTDDNFLYEWGVWNIIVLIAGIVIFFTISSLLHIYHVLDNIKIVECPRHK